MSNQPRGRPSLAAAVCLCVVLAPQLACGPGDQVRFHEQETPERLSEWNLFQLGDGDLGLSPGMLLYDLNSALFSDYAHKLRTVWLPPGQAARYQAEAEFDFPVGTIISKTFYYPLADSPEQSGTDARPLRVLQTAASRQPLQSGMLPLARHRLIETRLLVHRNDGWVALPYVWNEEQTDAVLEIAGDDLPLELVADDGSSTPFPYIVPDANQCGGCHITNHSDKRVRPIGPKARHLNRDIEHDGIVVDQLEHWAELGYLEGLPAGKALPRLADYSDPARDLNARARAYLDVNCSHCHSLTGPADTSGLYLDPETSDLRRLGMCKPPVAAGRGTGNFEHSIEPGRPEESIMIFRLASVDPGIAMPELGRGTVHREGVELLSAWIRSLEDEC